MLQAVWPNGVLALALISYLIWRPRLCAALVALLTYCTLHFSEVLWVNLTDPRWVMFMSGPRAEAAAEARTWGAVFTLSLLGVLAWRYRNQAKSWLAPTDRRTLLFMMSGCVALLLVGLAATSWISGQLSMRAVIDTGSTSLMFVLAGLLTVAWMAEDAGDRETALRRLLRATLVLTIVVNVAGALELGLGRSVYRNLAADGTIEERASSLLYNPNVMGLWCIGAAMIAGYVYLTSSRKACSVAVLVLAGSGLLLSGSRSSLVLYLMMVGVLLLHRVKHKGPKLGVLSPSIFVAGGLAALGGAAYSLERLLPAPPHLVVMVTALAERMLRLPVDVAGYLLSKAGSLALLSIGGAPEVASLQGAAEGSSGTRSSIAESIRGRFAFGENPDNAYLTVLQASGWVGLAALLAFAIWIAWLAYRRAWPRPELRYGYALAVGLGCVLSGMFLRSFQLFPVWAGVALGMSVVFTAVLTRESTE